MSTANGLQTTFVKYVIPSTGTGVAYTNAGAPITIVDSGRYLVQFSYAILPITAGANITSVVYAISTVAVLGGVGAVGLIQHNQSAASVANAINKCSNMGVINIAADDTPIYISLTATTSAGNYQTAVSTLDAVASTLTFIKIA